MPDDKDRPSPDDGGAESKPKVTDRIKSAASVLLPPLPSKEIEDQPDESTDAGRERFALQWDRAEANIKQAEADRARTAAYSTWVDLIYRILFAPVVFVLAVGWLWFVRNIVYTQGASGGPATTRSTTSAAGFHLSDGVLIALITTATLNVLALLVAVLAYFYWRPGNKKEASS